MDPRYFLAVNRDNIVACPRCNSELTVPCCLGGTRKLLVDCRRTMPPLSLTRLKEKLHIQPDGPSRTRLATRVANHPYLAKPPVEPVYIRAYCRMNRCECGLSFVVKPTVSITYYSLQCVECGCFRQQLNHEGLCLACTTYYCPLPNLPDLADSLSESGPHMSPARLQLLGNFITGILNNVPGMVVPDP